MLISIVRGTLTDVHSQIASGACSLKSSSVGEVTPTGNGVELAGEEGQIAGAVSRMM